jgi:hypothetical protein
MTNPYAALGENSFWKTAVANRSFFDISGLWSPKFQILPQQRVVTFGSCFAQHIGRALRSRGYNWFVPELPPVSMTPAHAAAYNYELFSARTGNIYTASLLRQWVEWALGDTPVPNEYWMRGGRFFDPFRPRVEPDGFESLDEMRASRDYTLECFRRALMESRYFVFTLGLTESWRNEPGNYEYPMCPGTAEGTFDPAAHTFLNQPFDFICSNLSSALSRIAAVNPRMRFILTVSPVPLTATNSNDHVLVATMASKSILRAVAGQLAHTWPSVDYFPSYEIINSPVFRGGFFEPNMRSVHPSGVDFVMNQFFACQIARFGEPPAPRAAKTTDASPKQVTVCEEQLLEAFGANA